MCWKPARRQVFRDFPTLGVTLPLLWTECLQLPKIPYVEMLTPHRMVLGSGALRGSLGREARALRNGVSALIRRHTRPEDFSLSQPCEDTARWPSANKEEVTHGICLHLGLGLPNPQNHDNSYLLFKLPLPHSIVSL